MEKKIEGEIWLQVFKIEKQDVGRSGRMILETFLDLSDTEWLENRVGGRKRIGEIRDSS